MQDAAEWRKACVDDASNNGSSSCIKECQEAMSLSSYTSTTIQTRAIKTQCVNTQVHLRLLHQGLAETRAHATKSDSGAQHRHLCTHGADMGAEGNVR